MRHSAIYLFFRSITSSVLFLLLNNKKWKSRRDDHTSKQQIKSLKYQESWLQTEQKIVACF